MKYLIDTSVWLEVLLNQDSADEARDLFADLLNHEIAISDFALHSLTIVLRGLDERETLVLMVDNMLTRYNIEIVTLEPSDMKDVYDACEDYGLDVDDAYQYVAAKKSGYTLISFDRDFNRTPSKRMKPREALAKRRAQ